MVNEASRRVLIVDDDSDVRRLLSTVLRERSLVVDEASDGRAAIDLLGENSYGVVLLDLVMPDADGFAVLDALAVREGAAPVVLVVTGAERAVVETLDAKRVHGIVRKPFDPDDVVAVVAACAELRARSAFETMALATMISSAPFLALLRF